MEILDLISCVILHHLLSCNPYSRHIPHYPAISIIIMSTVEHKIPQQQNGRDIQVVRIVTAVAWKGYKSSRRCASEGSLSLCKPLAWNTANIFTIMNITRRKIQCPVGCDIVLSGKSTTDVSDKFFALVAGPDFCEMSAHSYQKTQSHSTRQSSVTSTRT